MTIFNVTYHGHNEKNALILGVPDINKFLMTVYPIGKLEAADLEQMRSVPDGQCPKAKVWNADCDGQGHQTFTTQADLVRGELLSPPTTGAHVGEPRDPKYDNSYQWKFLTFQVGSGLGDMSISPTVKSSSNGLLPPSKGLVGGDMVTINKEQGTNDRTAVMQAIAFGAADVPEVLQNAEEIAQWLNERTFARYSPLVQKAVEEGALISKIIPKESPPNSTIKNKADLDQYLDAKEVSVEDRKRKLKEGGYESSNDFLAKNGSNYQMLASFLETHSTGDLPW
tara:strand:+ start:1047 stop:1892 length:846 start_codon:yes stop_codon:yes gene_type:complete